ncbi:glycoside hydrolase family protein [Horticoccus sp. 23ND18S-11]|uniref:hypothetical protein n=1 Tax=Horticoccus sp. 23ND18S-11 TaxID=3391832 RepID=UPI0039C984BA
MTTHPLLKIWALLAAVLSSLSAQPIRNARYTLEPAADGAVQLTARDAGTWTFRGDFVVLVATGDPKPAMRPGNIPRVPYNLLTWQTPAAPGRAALKTVKRPAAQAGDGFDDAILGGDTQQRTADVFAAAPLTAVRATAVMRDGAVLRFAFAEQAAFTLSATLALPDGDAEPVLAFTLTPKRAAWYSVGYTGAPAFATADLAENWQPFIWQEKRFPDRSYLTPAFECSLPATFVRHGNTTLGVVVDADEFPFSPLPLLDNSRFGVALRTAAGEARPMVFAPMLGGAESKRAAGQAFGFKVRLFAGAGDITTAYEGVARRLYGFRDHRRNAIASLNETLDNMIDYGMSRYSWFIEELKGCSYSTDVPGAVKNVSSLNPLNLALVTDDEEIFQRRAYPIVEFMLSREKFLFSLDAKQKIQSPSRALLGPCAPVSELATLYGITHGASPILRQLAERMLGKKRTLNLDDVAEGGTWPNQLAMYRETGEERFLNAARRGADAYLAERVARPAADFNVPGLFFWTGYVPQWIDLFQLYESTRDRRYLDAARHGARQYAMFTWMAPRIPDEDVTVNPGGNAPVYWYLKNKGHTPMTAPEERVPAWRLSEMGLTPESSGTMSGHRAVFMANHAPWMLRIAALTGDRLLHDVARSAIVGRYRNFPGYHINTARTTIYEDAGYPLREHKELSVNSFHYNHIWPHMSILLDFLVTDAFARSGGKIDFPAHFIEGYAYLQSKFYGDRPGKFFDRDDAVLWLPRRLLKSGSVELNTLAARGRDRLYLAFTNQSPEPVTTEITLSAALLPQLAGRTFSTRVLADGSATALRDGRLTVTVPALGLTAVEIAGVVVTPKFQDRLVGARAEDAWRRDYLELPFGGTRAMILNFGPAATTAYVYLQADDSAFKEVTLTYTVGGRRATLTDATFPFEFTVPVPAGSPDFAFELQGITTAGVAQASGPAALQR